LIYKQKYEKLQGLGIQLFSIINLIANYFSIITLLPL